MPAALADEVAGALEGLRLQTAAHEAMFGISKAAWQVDMGAGTIVFTSSAGIRAEAPVQVVGTHDSTDGSWLWAWDNASIPAQLSVAADRVRGYGVDNGFDVLTTSELRCGEERCWDFTALAAKLSEASGAYSGAAGTTRVFVTFDDLTLTKAP